MLHVDDSAALVFQIVMDGIPFLMRDFTRFWHYLSEHLEINLTCNRLVEYHCPVTFAQGLVFEGRGGYGRL